MVRFLRQCARNFILTGTSFPDKLRCGLGLRITSLCCGNPYRT